jgi:hypothetical protein
MCETALTGRRRERTGVSAAMEHSQKDLKANAPGSQRDPCQLNIVCWCFYTTMWLRSWCRSLLTVTIGACRLALQHAAQGIWKVLIHRGKSNSGVPPSLDLLLSAPVQYYLARLVPFSYIILIKQMVIGIEVALALRLVLSSIRRSAATPRMMILHTLASISVT